jgi:hypothetical protein
MNTNTNLHLIFHTLYIELAAIVITNPFFMRWVFLIIYKPDSPCRALIHVNRCRT